MSIQVPEHHIQADRHAERTYSLVHRYEYIHMCERQLYTLVGVVSYLRIDLWALYTVKKKDTHVCEILVPKQHRDATNTAQRHDKHSTEKRQQRGRGASTYSSVCVYFRGCARSIQKPLQHCLSQKMYRTTNARLHGSSQTFVLFPRGHSRKRNTYAKSSLLSMLCLTYWCV